MTTGTQQQVDVNVPRFNQALVAAFTAIAFAFQAWLLVTVVFLILAVTRFAGPQYGVFTQLYVRVVRPRRDQPIETEWSAPPQFAQLLGTIFLGTATVLFIAGLSVAGWAITLMVTALATLAATARICVGCIIYEQILDR